MTPKNDLEKGRRESGSVNRRDFLKTVGVTTLATSVLSRADAEAQAQRQATAPPPDGGASYSPIPQEVAENLRKRGIVGYADRLGVAPGEAIRFMVSSEFPSYRADIVRLIHGDPNPEGPGIKEIEIETPVSREYPGKRQDLPMGSYAVVPDHRDLRIRGSFTLTAWIAPTTAHPRPAEGILTKWSGENASGYGLFVEEDGTLALRLGAETLRAGAPLRPWVPAIPGMNERPQGVSTSWYFVAAAFDARSRKVLLYQQPRNNFPFDLTRSVVERETAATSVLANEAPLLIAAISAGRGGASGHYNGKIDNPRIYGRALSREEIEAIESGSGPTDALASWDFSVDIDPTGSRIPRPGRFMGGR
jgi:N,N-dimethylformamidase